MESLISTGLIGLSLGTQYAMIAIGFTLIFGIMGVINFMHGGGYVIGGYLTYTLVSMVGLPFWWPSSVPPSARPSSVTS